MKIYIFFFSFLCNISYSQSDFDKVLKSGEVLVNGLSFFKNSKSENKKPDSKTIESICVKNKLTDKITFKIVGIKEIVSFKFLIFTIRVFVIS